jgi:zinc/manganese transport system ATP-binding protein
MSAVAFDRVTLRRGARTVLREVTFTIPDGVFVGVLGPNGAGKTTAMQAMLGLLAPAAGSVTVRGRPAAPGSFVGYMPQRHADLPAGLSGREVVASAWAPRYGRPFVGRAGWAAVDRALALVDATALAKRRIEALSGGERQRLLLAQALLGEPRLLLLDEPLISLDPHRQAELVALVRRVQREAGITALFSAHELNPLLGALDLVLYLGAGRAALGTVAQVVTGRVLSGLYGTPIEVLEVGGRRFVMAGGQDMEAGAHRHEHPHAEHGHPHGTHP